MVPPVTTFRVLHESRTIGSTPLGVGAIVSCKKNALDVVTVDVFSVHRQAARLRGAVFDPTHQPPCQGT